MQLTTEGIAIIQIIALLGSLFLFVLTLWRAQKVQFNIAGQIQEYNRARVEGNLITSMIKVHILMSKGISLILLIDDITDIERKFQVLEDLKSTGQELLELSWWCGSLQDTIGPLASRMISTMYFSPARRKHISKILIQNLQKVIEDISEWLKEVIDEGLVRFNLQNPIYQE